MHSKFKTPLHREALWFCCWFCFVLFFKGEEEKKEVEKEEAG